MDEPIAAGARPRAESIVNVNELGFGTVAGICCGVFVKKGLKVRDLLWYPAGRLERRSLRLQS